MKKTPDTCKRSTFREKPRLVVTIDTEEDDWDGYMPSGATLDNIEKIARLQAMFDDLGVRPTYLVTYPVATNERAASLLKAIRDRNGCEIGAHVHPWNTPPFEEGRSPKNRMLCNLSPDLQEKKMRVLHDAIAKSFGLTPRSFRAGRWAYSESVGRNLSMLGYRVDTSLTPYTSWVEYGGPDFSGIPLEKPGISAEGRARAAGGDGIIEVPATIGFLQSNFGRCDRMLRFLNSTGLRKWGVLGGLAKLRLLNKAWLSPEAADAATMIRFTRVLSRKGFSVVNMFFHSTSLKAGLSPFVRTKKEEERFFDRIRSFLHFATSSRIESITLSETVDVPV